MNFSDVTSTLYAAQMTLAEKGISSAKVILTGFVVVFAVLFLLIGIIKVYGTIITKVTSSAEKKKQKVVESEKTTPVVAPVANPTPVVEDGVSEEIVAVISAAVATMYGSSGKARIKSIKKTNGGRSAWANAGVLENTRPF